MHTMGPLDVSKVTVLSGCNDIHKDDRGANESLRIGSDILLWKPFKNVAKSGKKL